MTNPTSTQESLVVGYFADGADAYRAINELIDEGFRASEIGAAFRAPRAGAEQPAAGELKSVRELTDRNPAVSGTLGGPASRRPGRAARRPCARLRQRIPRCALDARADPRLRDSLHAQARSPRDAPSRFAQHAARGQPGNEPWLEHLHRNWGSSTAETAKNRNTAAAGNQKFGTGEATLGLEHSWSEPAFETSFTGMGLTPEHARSLSGELGRGGAVLTVTAGERSSLAEAILERNHGRVRFEQAAGATTLRPSDRESPVQIYGSMSNYYRSDTEQKKKAS